MKRRRLASGRPENRRKDMRCIVDRFEGDYAIIEYESRMLKLPKLLLPAEAKEGDLLEVLVMLEADETQGLKEETEKLMEAVWEK